MHLGAATVQLQWHTTLTFVSPADCGLGCGERPQEQRFPHSEIEALPMVEVLNGSDNHQSSPMRRLVIPGVAVAHPLTLPHELGGSTAPSALGAKGNDCAMEIDDGDLGNLTHGLRVGLDDVKPDLGNQLHVQNVGCRAREGGVMVHSSLSYRTFEQPKKRPKTHRAGNLENAHGQKQAAATKLGYA